MISHRILPLALLVLALSVSSVAAADSPSAGVVAGVNVSSARLSGVDATGITSGTQAGLYIGGFVLEPVTPIVAIQAEAVYSQRHFTVGDTVGSFSATEKWDWIDVPILARISFGRASGRTAYVVAGPGFDFLVRAREDAGGISSNVRDDVKHVNVSIVAGAGISLGKFGVEARYDAGLRDLNQNNALGDNLTVKTRAITIDVRWMFR